MSTEKSNKSKFWSQILYPDSMPSDWQDIFANLGIKIAMSPLHDKDVDEDGSLKKPHYHCVFCFEGPTTYNNVKNRISDPLNGPVPQPTSSVRGSYRYFCHLDHPHKASYSPDDIQCFNGFNILDFVEYSKSEVLSTKKNLQYLIITEGFTEYSDFMDFVLLNGSELEYDVASGHTMFFNNYLKSRRYKTT